MRRADMKALAVLGLSVTLLGAAEPLATERHVHGVITAVDASKLTIASSQHAVSGKIDPSRTRVTVNGQPAKSVDLRLTAHAKGELGLDDVWTSISTH